MPRAAILNSRQSKTPVRTDEWVRNTAAAVRHASEIKGWDIVSSVGMFTWDLVTWLAGSMHARLNLVVPRVNGSNGNEVRESIVREFALVPDRIRWHYVDVAPAEVAGKNWWPERDRMVLDLADIALPISIRRGGALEQLIDGIGLGAEVDRRFEVGSYNPGSHHLRELVDAARLTSEIRQWEPEWLIHWTRTCHGPWPGETKAQFFEDFMEWHDDYCRSGFRTLQHILRERLIRASAWRIGGKQAMVAFTELSPVESLPLMCWRPRWSNWAFEPYGIAVRRDWAERLGIRPVRYVDADQWRKIPPEERSFAHSVGRRDPIWPAEREWRYAGNLNLTAIPTEALRIIVRERAEAAAVEKIHDALVLAFTGGAQV
jgi:hypothetical protein